MNERKHILIVDDNKVTLSVAKQALDRIYKVTLLKSGYQALDFLDKIFPDLIILDINMPDMDGIETLKRIRLKKELEDIPIIFLTAQSEGKLEAECLNLGAQDFITKPFFGPTVLSRVSRILELEDLRKNLQIEVSKKTQQIERIILQLITTIANVIDAKNVYSKGHSIRVASYSEEIAKRLGWEPNEVTNLQYSALLHDIGKINISDSIINKEGQLSEEEYSIIKEHTTIGAELLQEIIMIKNVGECAKYHHERYDGTGYNEGLSGEKIPLAARVVAVADAYDAMSSRRAYKPIMTKEEIIEELEREKGKQFDPDIAEIMIGILKDDMNLAVSSVAQLKIEGLADESSILLQRVMDAYKDEIKIVAQTDALTGLWNRKYMEEQVDIKLSHENMNGTLLMLDIDDFKHINDTYGHITGDETLIKFAETLKEIVGDKGLIGRIGGDEFIVFLDKIVDHMEIKHIAGEIISELEKRIIIDNTSETISVSIGIAVSPEGGTNFKELYLSADKSLYYVKQNGKNWYHFYSSEKKNKQLLVKESTGQDLKHINIIISEKQKPNGAYNVENKGFREIYNFVERNFARSYHSVQLLFFTITNNNGEHPNADILEKSFPILKKSIISSLRKGDVVTDYSSSQYVVLLINASYDDGCVVAERISSRFYMLYEHCDNIEINYNIQCIRQSK